MAETSHINLYYTEQIDNPTFHDWRNALAGQAGNMIKIDEAIAAKGRILYGNIYAANWDGQTQDVEFADLKVGDLGIISLSESATAEHEEAAGLAQLRPVAQNDDYVTIQAEGDVPEIDIPLALIIL